MNSGVRIIKRGSDSGRKTMPIGEKERTDRQSEREIASTIKGWIAEWAQRKQLDARSASALVKL
jgi:hypothetical protein